MHVVIILFVLRYHALCVWVGSSCGLYLRYTYGLQKSTFLSGNYMGVEKFQCFEFLVGEDVEISENIHDVLSTSISRYVDVLFQFEYI